MRGNGPPLLWISGYVVPARAFDSVTRQLADGYTVVAADHRGSGSSSPPWLPTTTATMAADALSVLDHLGIDSAHVVGVSLGGMVAQEVTIRSPQRVRSLVLGSTSAGGLGTRTPLAAELLHELGRTARRVPGRIGIGMLAAVRQGWAAATHDTTGQLDRIKVPTLVLHGASDELVPVANAEWLARRIPAAELRVIERAGHLLLLESPAARRALRQWLDKHAGRPAGPPLGAAAYALQVATTPWRLGAAQTLPLHRLLGATVRRLG